MTVLPIQSSRGGVMLKMLMCFACMAAMLVLGWMFLLPGLLTSVLEKRTGFIARVDAIYVNPFKGEINLRGLVIVNPPGFGRTDFIDLRKFTAKAEVLSLFGDHPVIDMSTIDLARLTVVTNAQGVNNVDLISRRLSWLTDKKVKAKAAATEAFPLKFIIRHLDVRLGEVVAVNDSGTKPEEVIATVDFHHTYIDIKSADQFLAETEPGLVASGTTIAKLIPGDVGRALGEATLRALPRQTYAFRKAGEKDTGSPEKLEEKPKH